jgi:hypothetical protein
MTQAKRELQNKQNIVRTKDLVPIAFFMGIFFGSFIFLFLHAHVDDEPKTVE